MPKALVIAPRGDYEIRDINGLDDMHAAVGSSDMDWSEARGELTYYCYGRALYESPRNPLATAMYRVTHDTSDPLCGPVLVMGPVTTEGEHLDIPDWCVESFLKAKDLTPQAMVDAGAVPLTMQERYEIDMKMVAAQGQARQALRQGRAVDFGGILLGPQDAVATAAAAALGTSPDLFAQLDVDGQHRSRKGVT